jgi:protein-tyrosine-phosphatase
MIRPQAVLFACNFNRIRSPIAAGLLRQAHGTAIYVDSCGLEAGQDLDPFALAVMRETGVDLQQHQAKTFDQLEDGSFDLVISLTPEAHARALQLTRSQAVDAEHWPTEDPSLVAGSRDQQLDAYRTLRDTLARRIADRFGRD